MIHKFSTGPPDDHSCSHNSIGLVVSDEKIFKFQPMRTHYGPWQPCWITNQHQKHKSGRGPFLASLADFCSAFQRRRFKCEKLTDGQTDGRRTLTHDKSSHGLWPGELKMVGVGKGKDNQKTGNRT